ncbi:MAG: hypothetical protein EOP06_11650, partial [Proteobacteria bacterium]
MKWIVLSLALITANAFAQTSTTDVSTLKPAAGDSASPTIPSPNASQNLTTQIEDGNRKLELVFLIEGGSSVADIKQNHSRALFDSINEVGLTYKFSNRYRAELRHVYGVKLISDREQLKNSSGAYESPYKVLDPTVHFNVATDLAPLGAKPMTISSRYSIPVSDNAKAAASQGVIRVQTALTWDLTPRWTVDYILATRLYLHATAGGGGIATSDPTLGDDSTLRYT